MSHPPRIETDCQDFINDTICNAFCGQVSPFYEAVCDGSEPEIKSANQYCAPRHQTWQFRSSFDLSSGTGTVALPVHLVCEAGGHTGIIDLVVLTECSLSAPFGQAQDWTLAWDPPQNHCSWAEAAEHALRKHVALFKLIRPYNVVLNYLATILDKVFFLDKQHPEEWIASRKWLLNYFHLVASAGSHPWHRPIPSNATALLPGTPTMLKQWDQITHAIHQQLPIHIALSLGVRNASWFDIKSLPLASAKELIREIHMKVFKKRTVWGPRISYNLKQLYANAEAQGLL